MAETIKSFKLYALKSLFSKIFQNILKILSEENLIR